MPVSCRWDETESNLIIFRFEGRWTWDEWTAADGEWHRLVNSHPSVVTTLLDFRAGRRPPPNLGLHMQNIARENHPKRGMVLIVGNDPVLNVIGKAMLSLFPMAGRRVRIFSTQEEARDFYRARVMS